MHTLNKQAPHPAEMLKLEGVFWEGTAAGSQHMQIDVVQAQQRAAQNAVTLVSAS